MEMELSLLYSFGNPRPARVSSSCSDLILWLQAIYSGIEGSQLFILGRNWREI